MKGGEGEGENGRLLYHKTQSITRPDSYCNSSLVPCTLTLAGSTFYEEDYVPCWRRDNLNSCVWHKNLPLQI